MHPPQPRPYGLTSSMGEMMATLLFVVDTWFEFANQSTPGRFQPGDRVDVLGHLVRLLSIRFHGFRHLPTSENILPVVSKDSVGLQVFSPRRVLGSATSVTRSLSHYGFRVVADHEKCDISVTCANLTGAQIIAFPKRQGLQRTRRGRGT